MNKVKKAVWEIADFLLDIDPNTTTKEVIAYCVARGIRENSARNRYNEYKKFRQECEGITFK